MVKSKKEIQFGIYGIFHNSKLIYIGQTTNFASRIKQHIKKLKDKKHIKSLQKYVDLNVKDLEELEFKLIHVTKDNSKIRLFMAEQILIMDNKETVLNKPVIQFGLKYIQFSWTKWDLGILKYI